MSVRDLTKAGEGLGSDMNKWLNFEIMKVLIPIFLPNGVR